MRFEFTKGIKMSPMEKLLCKQLNKIGIKHFREVTFDGLINPTTGCKLRYDVYVPSKNMIVEYDGRDYHTSEDVKKRDLIKDRFAKDNGMKLVRITGVKGIKLFIDKYFANVQPVERKKQQPKKKKPKKEERQAKPVKTQSEIREVLKRRNGVPSVNPLA